MHLAAKTRYALEALVQLGLAPEGEACVTRAIANTRRLPPKLLEQVMLALRNAGFVSAARGAGGGYTLARPVAEITLLAVVEAIEGPLHLAVAGSSAVDEALAKIDTGLREALAGVTIAMLVERERGASSIEYHI